MGRCLLSFYFGNFWIFRKLKHFETETREDFGKSSGNAFVVGGRAGLFGVLSLTKATVSTILAHIGVAGAGRKFSINLGSRLDIVHRFSSRFVIILP